MIMLTILSIFFIQLVLKFLFFSTTNKLILIFIMLKCFNLITLRLINLIFFILLINFWQCKLVYFKIKFLFNLILIIN